MKQIVAYKKKLICIEIPEPIIGPFEVKIKTSFSAYSFGTESTRVSNQSKLKMILSIKSYLGIINKIKSGSVKDLIAVWSKFNGFYSSLGYSIEGVITEIGSSVSKDLKIGDIVVAGGEYANHAEYNVVPSGLVFKVDTKCSLNSLAFVSSIPINSINQILGIKPKSILIIGGGLIGTIAYLYARSKGLIVSVFDLNESCMASKFVAVHKEISQLENSSNFDSILITSSGISDFSRFLKLANKGVMINVLGEIELSSLSKQEIEELYGSITFCNSFGYGRRNPKYEFSGIKLDKPHDRVSSIEENINCALKLLNELDFKDSNILNFIEPSDINLTSPNNQMINIFKY